LKSSSATIQLWHRALIFSHLRRRCQPRFLLVRHCGKDPECELWPLGLARVISAHHHAVSAHRREPVRSSAGHFGLPKALVAVEIIQTRPDHEDPVSYLFLFALHCAVVQFLECDWPIAHKIGRLGRRVLEIDLLLGRSCKRMFEPRWQSERLVVLHPLP